MRSSICTRSTSRTVYRSPQRPTRLRERHRRTLPLERLSGFCAVSRRSRTLYTSCLLRTMLSMACATLPTYRFALRIGRLFRTGSFRRNVPFCAFSHSSSAEASCSTRHETGTRSKVRKPSLLPAGDLRESSADILRTLDTMASTKLNTFHWHITDQQSFPLEIPTFPDLATYGAYSADRVYSTVDVSKVVEYGRSVGVAVMLEVRKLRLRFLTSLTNWTQVDMPGHTASIANAYPEHIACLDARPWSTYAAEPPAGEFARSAWVQS